jgi:hypothetical protein
MAVAPEIVSLNPNAENANIQVTSSVPRFPGPAGMAVAKITMVKARVRGNRETGEIEEKMKNAVRISQSHTRKETSKSSQNREKVSVSRKEKSVLRNEMWGLILNNTSNTKIMLNIINEAYPMIL